MTRPAIRRATELPVVSWNDWDNVQLVKAAIQGLEQGIFHQASLVVEAMGRDDRISGCLETRTRALPSLPLMLEPRGDGRQKRAVAKALDEEFETMYPDATLTELQLWGTMLGIGLGENIWQYGDRWTPKLKVWHPRALTYRQDTRSFWVQTMEGPREVIPGNGQWVVYTPYGLDRGWMHGKVRSLYVSWLMRTWGLRDWARYSEVHGHPIKKVVTPAGAQEDDKQRFLTEVAGLASEATIRTPRVAGMAGALGPDTDRYDLELLEPKSMNWQTFEKLLDKAEANIAINLLGQNLSTEVKGGSYAATAAHMMVKAEVMQFDAESLGQCLRTQSIGWWALHNFGSAELAPMPKWKTKTKTPEERTSKGTALKNLGDGITSLRAAGVQVDADKITEEEEIPTTGPAEDPPPEAEVAPGGAPATKAKPTKLPRPKAASRQALPTFIGPCAHGRDPYTRCEEGCQNLTPAKAEAMAKLAQDDEDLPPAAVEGQLYVDRLADDGTPKLAAAMAPDLKKVLAAIRDSKDFAGLRASLNELFGELTADEEEELLRQGMLMAELAGRYAARKEAGLPAEPEEKEE